MTAERTPLWTSEDAGRATQGWNTQPWAASGVSIDSRTVQPGDLFVALRGPTFDGHDFVTAALDKGAAAALVARVPDGAGGLPMLVVEDTFEGLQALGAAARRRARARIVGVTGSVGKTGVKEALRLALGRQGATHASDGSLNNHWGVPLSLSRLPPEASYAVFEMGMNHAGEITPLTLQARPQVALITTVEAVHIENFGSEEAIADAKAEIFAGVEPGGAAVLNRDNRHFERLADRAREAGIARVLAFGRTAGADACLIEADEDADGTTIRADVAGRRIGYRLGIPGRHWIGNSLGVLATALALSADVDAAAAALADLRPPKGRGMRHTVPLRGGGSFVVIDDSYNASPPSMAASFQVLGSTRPAPGGRRLAALGDMLELGSDAAARHSGLADPLTGNGIDLVFTAGPLMSHLHERLPAALRGGHAGNAAELAPLMAASVRAGDVIVVKGSAGSRMRTVVDALLALADARSPETISHEASPPEARSPDSGAGFAHAAGREG